MDLQPNNAGFMAPAPGMGIAAPDQGQQALVPVSAFQQPQDTFVRQAPQPPGTIALGDIRPDGLENRTIPIQLKSDGSMVQETLAGPQVIGQLDTVGNYRLANGKSGSIFQDKVISIGYKEGNSPFLTALRESERARARNTSTIPLIRQNLTQQGINGQGIKIGIIDPYEKDKPKPGSSPSEKAPDNWKLSDHSKTVAAIINDQDWGVAPGASVVDAAYVPTTIKEPSEDTDDPAMFAMYWQQAKAQSMLERANQIQKLCDRNDPALRVVNMTQGASRTLIYKDVWSALHQMGDNGHYKYPAIRQAVLGNAQNGTREEQMQAVINYVDNTILGSPQFQYGNQQYLEATRRAASQGIILVAAAANEHGTWTHNVPLPPGSEMDLFAQGPYVIITAASNTNQTPGDRRDDLVSGFSSRGDGRNFNPTIAAPGSEMGFSREFGGLAHNGTANGTSYSTPYTCGVIAMMLQKNPYLTFEQVKTRLQQSAVNPNGLSVAEVGAGFIDPVQAVLAP